MPSLNDLKTKARQTTKYGGRAQTLLLDRTVPAEQVISGLVQYFGEDEAHEAIRLTVDGEKIGYLLRSDLYDYEGLAFKGIGAGDYTTIPGVPDFNLLRLRCPKAGCLYRPLVASFDEDNPPQCEIHPGTAMEIAR